MTDAKAYLFLDVDGPLNPYAAPPSRRPEGYQTFYLTRDNQVLTKDETKGHKKSHLIRVWYNPAHGADLLNLTAAGFEVVWATKWNDLANLVFPTLYGTSEFPVALVDEGAEVTCGFGFAHQKGCSCLHSKTKTLLKYAEDKPFVWVDDEATKRDQKWLADNAAQAHDVRIIDPRYGLTSVDFDYLKNWVSNLD